LKREYTRTFFVKFIVVIYNAYTFCNTSGCFKAFVLRIMQTRWMIVITNYVNAGFIIFAILWYCGTLHNL